MPLFQPYAKLIPRSEIEVKVTGFVLHYIAADLKINCSIVAQLVAPLAQNLGKDLVEMKNKEFMIELRLEAIAKGVYRKEFMVDFVLYLD